MSKTLEELNREALLDEYSDQRASEHRQFYLREAGLDETLEDMQWYDKHTVFDVLLNLQLDELKSPEEPATERDELVSFFFEKGWFPKNRDEVRAALPSDMVLAELKPARLSHAKNGKQLEYAQANKMFHDAEKDEQVFASIGVHKDKVDFRNRSKWLRQSRKGQYLMADMLMAKEFLDQGDWPDEDSLDYYARQSYWRGFTQYAAEFASDNTLDSALKYFFDKSGERRRFASRLLSAAQSRIGSLTLKPVKPEPTEKITAQEGTMALIPEDQRRRLEQMRSEYAAMAERLDPMGMPQAEKMASLWRSFPELKPVELQYLEEQREDARKRERKRLQNGLRKKTSSAKNPGLRRSPAYDKQQDPSNPRPI